MDQQPSGQFQPAPQSVSFNSQQLQNLDQPKPNRNFFGEARAYLVEYAIGLVAIGTLLGVVVSMINTILKYKPEEAGYFADYAYQFSIFMIATLLVAIPTVLLLESRTQRVESASPVVKDRAWRKGFLGFFLINVGLWALGSTVAFVYDLVGFFASIGISDDNDFPWRGLLANGLSALLLFGTLWLYSHDYRDQAESKPLLKKLLHFGLIGFSLVLTFIYLLTTFNSQRGAFIDSAISGDISSIQNQYSSKRASEIPESINDVKLNDKQKSRAEKYDYEFNKTSSGFEVCANFKTNTEKKDSGSDNPLEAFSGSSYSSDSKYESPYKHPEGKKCFETETYSSRYSDDDLYRQSDSRSDDYDLN